MPWIQVPTHSITKRCFSAVFIHWSNSLNILCSLSKSIGTYHFAKSLPLKKYTYQTYRCKKKVTSFDFIFIFTLFLLPGYHWIVPLSLSQHSTYRFGSRFLVSPYHSYRDWRDSINLAHNGFYIDFRYTVELTLWVSTQVEHFVYIVSQAFVQCFGVLDETGYLRNQ